MQTILRQVSEKDITACGRIDSHAEYSSAHFAAECDSFQICYNDTDHGGISQRSIMGVLPSLR